MEVLTDRARPAVLLGQLPRRHDHGQRRLGLQAPQRLLHGAAALPGFAEPAEVPVGGAQAGPDLQEHDHLPVLSQVSASRFAQPAPHPSTTDATPHAFARRSQPPTLHSAALDWLAIALYFGILLGVAWWVVSKNKDTAADYFLAGRNLGWWVIGASIFASNIGSEHIVGLAGSGRQGRRGHGALRIARLVSAGAGLGLRAVLRALAGVHHAGVPRTPLLHQLALRAVHRLARHVHRVEDRGRHFRGRRGLRHAAAGTADQPSAARDRQLLDWLGAGHRADRPLHDARRHARRGLQRRRSGRHPDRRLGPADVLRAEQARRLGRAAASSAARTCSTSGSRWSRPAWKAPGRR